jgi:hypothetical protein
MTVFLKPLNIRLGLLLLSCISIFAPSTNLNAQGCSCTNCPQFMPDNFVGNFDINVMGATNPTLGQNGQGVCGVTMSLDHEYIGDLSIVLTSPGGQSVTLIGPIGLFGETDFSSWNIGFVPCGDPASPDPGFNDQWSNNQAWGQFGNFTGSYYPSNGCLENFNSGPVNGTWVLTVTDGQGNDVGNFLNYEIIFCDPDGIICFSCAAEAGNLAQNNVSACQGSPNLVLNLPPSYPAPLVAPPASEYSYTYIISGAGGVILSYDDNLDFTGYDPGVYNVCGLSYYTDQFDLIPAPNGTLTTNQLSTQLASNTPPFCGDVSGDCVSVTINSSPPDEEEYATICAPMCYQFFNQPYCQSGTYVRNLLSPQGCPYVATLYLTVLQPTTKNIIETVCAGECSTTPGFEGYCSQGNYQEIFMNNAGCDSIVNLNLLELNVVANIVQPSALTCSQPTQQLLGVGSTAGQGASYLWSASNGGNIVGGVTSINALINAPGTYQLRVCKNSGGAFCCDSAQVDVISNQVPPAAPAAVAGSAAICQGQTLTYTATTVADATSYIWTVPPGVIINTGQNTQTINVTWNSASGGNVCAAASNLCGTSTPTCLTVTVSPTVTPTQPLGIASVCANTTETYTIPPVAGATNYTWSISGGGIITSGQGTTAIVVSWGSTSGSVCVNATSSCGDSPDVCLPVTVTSIPPTPVVTGNLNSCPGFNAAYSVPIVPGATTYNWQVTNGSVALGQGTNNIQASWNSGVTSGVVCVNAANVCGNSPDTCLTVSLSIPLAGQITTTCDPTNSFYTVSFPISGGTPPYSIQIMGGTITNGVFTSVQIPSGLLYNFEIVDATLCISALISGSFNCACSTDAGTMNLAPLSACEGQTVTAMHQGGQNLDGNDVAAFILHSNSGTSLGTVFGENNTGTFGFSAGMAYETTYYISFVVGNNLGGLPDPADPCLSVSQGQPVIFHQNPVANAGVDADTCGLTLALQGNVGVGSGTWTILTVPGSNTLNLSGVQNPNTTATASDYGVYTLSWMLDNNGCTDVDTVSLDFNDVPLASNLVTTCDAANENYSVSFQISGGTPNYSTTGTPTGTATGNTYSSGPIPNGGVYDYLVTDNAGCTSPPITGSFSCNCASNAGTMDVGMLSACESNTVSALYLGGENLDGNDVSGFFLHTGSANTLGTVFAENTTGVFSFQSGMTYGATYYISYVVGNSLNGIPDTTDFCLSVSAGQPVVFYQNPTSDAGIDLDTCGTVLNLNGNMLVNGAGLWTVTAGNVANISINESINPLSSVSSSQAGAYTLTWTITQNGCVGTDQVMLQFNDSPVLSNLMRTCDATNENFTVSLALAGGTAPYSVNGSPVTGTSFVSNPFANGLSYTFNVVDANGCSMPTIMGAYSCNCATNAGTMALQTLSVCEGLSMTVTANNDQTLDINDVTSYVLHNGAGQALGQVFAQNTTGVFTLQSGMNLGETYYVSLVAGNLSGNFPDPSEPCFSVAAGQPVVWLETPSPDAGADDATCGETFNLPAVGNGFDGIWTQVAGPGTAAFVTESDPTSIVTVSSNGSYTFQWTESNGTCVGNDDVTIDFNASPVLTGLDELCNGTNTQYVISFTASGGLAPYTVIGLPGAFTGLVYSSSPLDNDATYSFGVVDDNGCPSMNFSGSQHCDCATDAGSMLISPGTFCEDTPASATWNNDGNTDTDDAIQFILHSTSDATLGTVYGTNIQPTFNFAPPLQTGVTYYISAIAGNKVGTAIQLSDPCLNIAPGVPVQWKPMPEATMTGDATLCAGDGAALSFSGTGVYPLTLTYTDGASQNTLVLPDNQAVLLNLIPAGTSTVTLLLVEDSTLPTCSTVLNSSVTLTVNQPVDAGTANEPVEFCEGVDLPIVLSNLITGADFGGQWAETSVVLSLPGAFNAATGAFQTTGQPAGTYTFRYRLNASPPCISDEETVTVIIDPIPIADAGENQAINCDQSTVTLGGSGTTPGVYQWILDGNNVGDTKQIIVTDAGTYTLMVTNPAGCTDDDEAIVIQDNEQPVAEAITLNGVRCFGEVNGAISIDSVSTAHAPVRYALNGGAFQLNPYFTGLAAGDYTVTLMDANGCESTTAVLTVLQPPQLIANLGADIEAALSDSVHLTVETTLPLLDLDTILWQPLLDTSANRRLDEQHFLPLQSWRVKVTVIDSNGCTAVDEVLIRLDKPRNIFIPNIFNPENGQDPVLYIFGGSDVAEVESFVIFDRWGTQLFEQKNFQPNDPAYGWDGRYKGALLNPAVFVCQANVRFIDGQKILYKGSITLIR